MRDSKDFSPQVLNAVNIVSDNDGISVFMSECSRPKRDSLLPRFDGKLDEYRGAVNLARIQSIHKLRPGAIFYKLNPHRSVGGFELLCGKQRQSMCDRKISDAYRPRAVFRCAWSRWVHAAAREQQACADQKKTHQN